MNDIKKLIVKYNSSIVGYLVETSNESIAFQYDSEWLKNGFSISPFSLPLTSEVFINKKMTFDGLYGVFQDSMPDGWGELLMRRMLIKQDLNWDKLSPLTKLSLVNENGLGALTYEPSQTNNEPLDYDLDKLATESKIILKDESFDVDLDNLYKFGGSSGGARPKAHIKIDNEYWIVKFPCHFDPENIGEKEYKANILAQKCGVQTNECTLMPSKICSGFFAAKRFDRTSGKKFIQYPFPRCLKQHTEYQT